MRQVTPPVIGLFGGTFNPVHFGHLRLAEEAREQLRLKEVLWIPAGNPKHRTMPEVSAEQRLEMVRLALANHPDFKLDSAEVLSDQPSYTVPTLERLRTTLGESQPLVLLLGADAFVELSSWHRWHELLELTHIGLSHRPGFALTADHLPQALAVEYRARLEHDPAVLAKSPAGRIVPFAMTQLAISATQIRELLAKGGSSRYLLPDAIIDYIDHHHLYRKP